MPRSQTPRGASRALALAVVAMIWHSASAPSVAAQEVRPALFPTTVPSAETPAPLFASDGEPGPYPEGRLYLYGAGGLVAGIGLAVVVGSNLVLSYDAGFAALMVGPVLTIPLAVHLGNRRQGNYWISAGTGVLMGAAAIAGLYAGGAVGLVAVPLLLIPISIAIETSTSR